MNTETAPTNLQGVIDYEEAKRLIVSADPVDRRRVAADPHARAEMLFYLASDSDPDVRKLLAGNAATPAKADLLLIEDEDETVRVALAAKISQLAPTLSERETNRLQQLTYETLEKLVRDQTVRIRQIVADTLAHMPEAPVEIIQRLARDPEIAVAGPPLQYSPLLTEDDLIDILSHVSTPGAASAIARRQHLSPAVADVIGGGEDVDAITALLENPSAQIREDTLDRLIERAPAQLAWHRPLTTRPVLSERAICKLAQFVAKDMLDTLQQRTGLSANTRQELEAQVSRRLSVPGTAAAAPPAAAAPAPSLDEAVQKAAVLASKGQLTETLISEAVDENQQHMVIAGLAQLSGLETAVVGKILHSNSAKGITALIWRAELSMRLATKLQIRMAHMSGNAVLYAKPDGSFPLAASAMEWQIEFFVNLVAADG
ncbi:MAG TPA: DUF2336 domain-containing protein [Stellaceae bacterium]|nr:DUF2336 domain-containing protein [Stellaceae bacterium]